jgi:serralysin
MTTSGSNLELYMLDLINEERAANGLAPLKLEQNLNQSSEDHSLWMLEADIFSHTGAGGSTAKERMVAADFDFSGSWRSGENIGFQSERGAPGLEDDVEDVHDSLMLSSGHRWNILNADYDYVGIGIEYGNYNGYNGVMITQNFAATSAPVILDGGNTGPAPTPSPTPTPTPAPTPTPVPPSEEPTEPEEILGTSGKDVLSGTSAGDVIRGLGGNDVLNGAGGNDIIWGGNGKDWLIGGAGADELRGGKGVDVVDYHGVSGGVTADLQHESNNTGAASGDIYYSIAWLRGSSHDDTLRGNDWANQLRGGSGDDILNGRAGNDVLYGGNGDDVLRGAEDDDILYGMSGADRFVFETGMGSDVVKDFVDGQDLLDFRGVELGSFGALMARAEESGGDVVFDLDGADAVIIENTTLSQIQDDILF